MSQSTTIWKTIATVLAVIAWSMTTAICGWNLHETIIAGKEIARIETKLDMIPLAKSDKATAFAENNDQ